MINPIFMRIMLCAALLIGGFLGGWRVKSAFVAERDLAQAQERQANADAQLKRESIIAERVASQIADINANQKVIEREKIKLVEKPVYRNQCLDDEGIRLIEQAREGVSSNGFKD